MAPRASSGVVFVCLLVFVEVVVGGPGRCPVQCTTCKNTKGKYIVTRLWNIINFNAGAVINEFDRGFAPIATQLAGFDEYTAAETGIPNTVFFMNIFDTAKEAAAVQTAALNFVNTGELRGKITPNEFHMGKIAFDITADPTCKTHPSTTYNGFYLSTRLWKLTPTSKLTGTDVTTAFFNGFGPIVSKMHGFHEYVGAVVDSGLIFFFNVFETATEAAAANAAAKQWVDSSSLNGQITPVTFPNGVDKFTAGPVRFDYICQEFAGFPSCSCTGQQD